MTPLESLHTDAFAAMALRLLAAGHVRLYEHVCKKPWFRAPSLLQVFTEAAATLPVGTDPPLHAGEAEFAANLATVYEHRYLSIFRRAVIWKLLQSTYRT